MTLPIRRYLPQPSLDIVLQINTIKWAVVCFTLLMDDGYYVRDSESLEVDNCGHSVAFRDLTCSDWDFYLILYKLSSYQCP